MSSIYNFIPQEIVSSIGWTLLHSLWQGGLIAVILYVTLYLVRDKSANLKALLSTAALLLIIITAVVTYKIEFNSISANSSNPAGIIAEQGINNKLITHNDSDASSTQAGLLSRIYENLQVYFSANVNLIVTIWIAGLFLFTLRFLGGLFYLARIRRKVSFVRNSLWNNRIEAICNKINFKNKISLAESLHTRVPVVVGYFKPVILFPFGLLTGLPQEQIEAILYHELAHLKRYDLIINLFQSIAETIFFYNPFVWWISNKIRIEREYCCDDIAISLCGNELVYAKALVNLESLIESNLPLFAIPLFKNKNQLLRRITRMLHKNDTRNSFKEKFAAVIIFIGILISAAVFKNVNATTPSKGITGINAATQEMLPGLPSVPELPSVIDTTISKKKGTSTMTFSRTENGEEIEYRAKLKDGKLVTLYRDDEKVAEKDLGKYKAMIEEMVKKHEAEMAQHKKDMIQHEKDMIEHEKNMKQHEIDMKKHNEEMKQHEIEMKKHDQEMELHKIEMAKHEVEMKKHNAFMKDLKQMLVDEGIIKKGDNNFNLKLTSKKILVEGEKLSDDILSKAKKLYKKHYDKEMSGSNSITINNGGSSINLDDNE